MIPKALVKFLLVAVLFGLTYGGSNPRCRPRQNCLSKLGKEGITPKYADSVDTTNVKIVYSKNYTVRCGNRLPLNQLSSQPEITFSAAKHNSLYTIVLFDPDQSLPFTNYIYYLVVNVPGSDLCNGKVDKGYIVLDYIQPNLGLGPVDNNDKFVYFVYEQENGKIKKKDLPADIFIYRYPYDPKGFAKTYHLGCPRAAQYHRLVLLVNDPGTVVPKGDTDGLPNMDKSQNLNGSPNSNAPAAPAPVKT